MDEVLDIFVALTESVRRLEGGVESISKDAQVAIVELQKALQHAGKAAEHAECAEKAVDRADARMKEVAAMLGGVSNKNISVDAVCSLMRQLNGAKKNIMRLVQETLEDERRATDARRVAADHGDSAPLAKKASERSAEELELVRKGARRIREGVERDVQSIDLHLVSLRNVLLNLNSGRANGSRNLTAFCDEAQDRVMGESIRVAVVRLVRSRGIADAATAHRRVRDVAADLTTLHGLSRDAGSHSERAAAYAEESIALSKGEGASRSVASARSGDAETDSGVDVARQTSVLGTSDNATLSAGRDAEEEAKVVGGKLSGNTTLVMWVLVIGLSLLFLLFVFLFSLWRPIRNRAKAHVTSSEL
ncbi:putative Glutamic acid alanine rich protein of Trypanosoma [Trypanosoma vivax]|nr:putative Glutamic acid alanine rich protein of Trypanosoma [Trypanosoma vivax]